MVQTGIQSPGAKNSMTITTTIANELWSSPAANGPYKRTDAVITREFIALQSKQRLTDFVKNAPNWFGVPAGVFATLRRPSSDGSGKLGKNGWTAELLIQRCDKNGKPNGEPELLSGLTIGAINALPANALVRIVNVKPADPVAIVTHYTSTALVRGSQKLPDADRNPATGAILKPDAVETPAPQTDAPIVAETIPTPTVESTPETPKPEIAAPKPAAKKSAKRKTNA